MNTRDMLERAVDIIERLDLLFLNKGYLTTSDKEIAAQIDSFMNEFEEM